MIHLWHEDSENSSTTQFWEFLKKEHVSSILDNADIRGFSSNSALYNHIQKVSFNKNDIYYIFIDKVFDNNKAYKYYKDAKRLVSTFPNVILADLLCFEYLMLKFRYIEAWTRPMKNSDMYNKCLKAKEEFKACVESGESWTKVNDIISIVVILKNIDTNKPNWKCELNYISSETVATSILSAMVNGGTTDFNVSKTRFGLCWTCKCCSRYTASAIADKKCRIYRYRKTSNDKAGNLWNNTQAKSLISKGITLSQNVISE